MNASRAIALVNALKKFKFIKEGVNLTLRHNGASYVLDLKDIAPEHIDAIKFKAMDHKVEE